MSTTTTQDWETELRQHRERKDEFLRGDPRSPLPAAVRETLDGLDCAYSAAYECPLIPTENWLDVRVEAGERVGV